MFAGKHELTALHAALKLFFGTTKNHFFYYNFLNNRNKGLMTDSAKLNYSDKRIWVGITSTESLKLFFHV